MTGLDWRSAGRIDHAPVTHLALSPWFGIDRCVVASTPAGVHTSRDGGLAWDRDDPAKPWPFVTGLAVGGGRSLLAASSEGVRFSRDWGDTWHDLHGIEPAKAVFTLDDDRFVVADELGRLLTVNLNSRTIDAVSELQDVPFRIVRAGDILYALGDRFLASTDGGITWSGAAASLDAMESVDIAAGGGRCLALPVDGSRLWSIAGDGITGLPLPAPHLLWASIAASGSGRTIVLGGDQAVAISIDGGLNWSIADVPGPVVSVAIGGHGAGIAAGLVDGRVMVSRNKGRTWSTTRLIGGTIVTRLVAAGDMVRATTIEGADLETVRTDQLADWQPCDHSVETIPELPELRELDGEIVDVSRDPDGTVIAVGSRSSEGACSVWTAGFDGRWRKLIAHPETARTVALTRASRLFAGIGDSVYRPWRGGPGLAAREQVDPGRVHEVLAIESRQFEPQASVVVALTDAGFYRSDDDGLSWTALGAPDGAPVTAFNLQAADGGCEILVAQLGGSLMSRRLDVVSRR